MTLLLVNPNREHRPIPAMPMGMLRVAESAEEAGIPVHVLDLTFGLRPAGRLRAAIRRHRPALLGFTIRNLDNADFRAPRFYLQEVKALVDAARVEHRGPIVVGGPGVAIAPDAVREYLGVDCAVVGPGEAAIRTAYALAGGGLPPTLREPVDATRPDADLARWLDLAPWRRLAAPIPIQTRRGCPRHCVYCNYAALEGTERYVLQDPGEVVDAVRRAVRDTGIRAIEFVDSTFNVPTDYAMRLCEALAEADLRLSLGASGITPRGTSKDLLIAMRRAGFRAIWCSPDTAAPETIASYRKGFDRGDLERMARDSAELGFVVMWSFLFGGPGETGDTVAETLRFVREQIAPEHPVLYTSRMRIYPGTRLAETAALARYPAPTLDPRAAGQFYLSPHLDAAWLDAEIDRAFATRANVMLLETAQRPIVGWLQRWHGLLRRPEPTWTGYVAARRRLMGGRAS